MNSELYSSFIIYLSVGLVGSFVFFDLDGAVDGFVVYEVVKHLVPGLGSECRHLVACSFYCHQSQWVVKLVKTCMDVTDEPWFEVALSFSF